MAGEEGLEPPTPGFGDRCSNQLSYTPTDAVHAASHAPMQVWRATAPALAEPDLLRPLSEYEQAAGGAFS